MLNTIALAQQLIKKPSVTPNDAGCQNFLAEILSTLKFTLNSFDCRKVKNLWARYGREEPLFIFAGHTDVVPPGELSAWQSPPFEPETRDNYLFGRGACDMKGSLAAMLTATERFLTQYKKFSGSIGFLITSGEEGDDFEDGTPYVMEQLQAINQIPQYCIVGEPSSETLLGDTIKIGRRGSLTGYLKIIGKQGHVAYPQYAKNPVHEASAMLHELTHINWDKGNEYFPPTSFQITKIQADGGSSNVVPGELHINFNFRYSSATSQNNLQQRVEEILKKSKLAYEIKWRLNGLPFLTHTGHLLEATKNAIHTICGITPVLSTSGGTSDGRFIAPYGVDVIELGLINKTIHQINESASIDSLHQLSQVYEKVLEKIFIENKV